MRLSAASMGVAELTNTKIKKGSSQHSKLILKTKNIKMITWVTESGGINLERKGEKKTLTTQHSRNI